MKKLMSYLIVLAGGVVAWYILTGLVDVTQHQRTVYSLILGKHDTGAPLPGVVTVYRVYPETQTVISWIPNLAEAPDRLSNCAVRDRSNWKCEDEGVTRTMVDGEFSETWSKESVFNIAYTSRLKYLWLKYGGY